MLEPTVMFKRLSEDIAAVRERDPAARSTVEILFCYPGLHALIWHRLSAWLWHRRLRFLGRLVSHVGRMLTGIEIHPGARIGRRVFIDHGLGVVIGETAEIGDDCTIYQGATLGGTALTPGVKRHPTLEEGVIVGSGAQILGPLTVGAGARIGANAVVLKDVAVDATMVGIPAQPLPPRAARHAAGAEAGAGAGQGSGAAPAAARRFVAYGTPCEEIEDPVGHDLCRLLKEVARLTRRVDELEGRVPEAPETPGTPETPETRGTADMADADMADMADADEALADPCRLAGGSRG